MRGSGRYWYDAVIWLVYTVVGMLLPVGLALIVALAMRLEITLGSLTHGGQFAIYSAGMWVTTYYLIARPTSLRLPFTEVLGLVCAVGLVVSAGLFMLAVMASNGAGINRVVVEWPSIAVFVISVAVTFVAVALDRRRMTVNPRASRQADREALGEAFDKTAGQGETADE